MHKCNACTKQCRLQTSREHAKWLWLTVTLTAYTPPLACNPTTPHIFRKQDCNPESLIQMTSKASLTVCSCKGSHTKAL